MDLVDIASLTHWVLLSGFGVAFLFGALAQRTHFCTMGAISDVVNMGDWTRARQWVLAIGVAMMGFAALSLHGDIAPDKALYAGTRLLWLSCSLGGLMFGFGMVLASGCGNKSLVRVGSGNLKSLVVLLVMGVAAFATLKGITGVLRVSTVDRFFAEMPKGAHLGGLFNAMLASELTGLQIWLGFGLGLMLMLWALSRREFWSWENLLAGAGAGLLVVAMWWVSGSLGHVAEHPDTLEEVFLTTNSGRMESLSFVAPVAYLLDWLMFYSDKSKLLSLGIVSVLGVIAGSFVMSRVDGSFRFEGFGSVEDLGNHLAGAVLMGVGGVTAMGCTIGQGLSGVSTLSLNSGIALASIVVGALAGFRYQIWRLERQL
jgi:uncharacterized membrane protein YedE/YeeE